MDESEIDALLSLSTENHEVPLKRRKLNPVSKPSPSPLNPPDSNSKRLSAFERIQFARQLAALRTKLLKTQATVARIHRMKKQMEEFFESEKRRLGQQVRLEEEEIETLEVSLETGITSSQGVKKSQTPTETDMESIEKRIREKIDVLISENNNISDSVILSQYEKISTPSKPQKSEPEPQIKPVDRVESMLEDMFAENTEPRRINVPNTTLRQVKIEGRKPVPVSVISEKAPAPSKPKKSEPEPQIQPEKKVEAMLGQVVLGNLETRRINLKNTSFKQIKIEGRKGVPVNLNPEKISTPSKPQKSAPDPKKQPEKKVEIKLGQQFLGSTENKKLNLQNSDLRVIEIEGKKYIPVNVLPSNPERTPKPQKCQSEPQTQPVIKVETMLGQVSSGNTEPRKINLQNTTLSHIKIENKKPIPVNVIPLNPEKIPAPLKPQRTTPEHQPQPEKTVESILGQKSSGTNGNQKVNLQNTALREVEIDGRKYIPVTVFPMTAEKPARPSTPQTAPEHQPDGIETKLEQILSGNGENKKLNLQTANLRVVKIEGKKYSPVNVVNPEKAPTPSRLLKVVPQPLKVAPQPQQTAPQPQKKVENMLERIFPGSQNKKLHLQNAAVRQVNIEGREYIPISVKMIEGQPCVIKLQQQPTKDGPPTIRIVEEDKLPLKEKIFNKKEILTDSDKVGKQKESKPSSEPLKQEIPRVQIKSESVEMQEENVQKARVDDLQENGTPKEECEDPERMGEDLFDDSAEKSESELVVDEFASDQIDVDDSTCEPEVKEECPEDYPPDVDHLPDPDDQRDPDDPAGPDHRPGEEDPCPGDHLPEDNDESSADHQLEDNDEHPDHQPDEESSSDHQPDEKEDSSSEEKEESPDNPPEDENKEPSDSKQSRSDYKLIMTDAPAIGQQQQHELRVPASGHYVLASDSRFFKIPWEKHFRRDGPKDLICNRCAYLADNRQRMQDHIWVKHFEGHFKCPLCPASRFMLWRHNMKKHIQRVHLIVLNASASGK